MTEGRQGPQGEQGSQGIQGDQGVQGFQGGRGTQGIQGEQSISIPTPFGPIHVAGLTALFLIMNLGFFWYIYNENTKRQAEHLVQNAMRQDQFQELSCKFDLDLFIHSFPRGEIRWGELPGSMTRCLPDYVYQGKVK